MARSASSKYASLLALSLTDSLTWWQTALVKSKFVEAIQNYQQVEQQYRQRYKQRLERQYKIVNPNATPDEVRAVVNDENGGQIFSQAVRISNQYSIMCVHTLTRLLHSS